MKVQAQSESGSLANALRRFARIIADETGAEIVEFTLSAIVLFTLFFGIAGFSMVMFFDLMTSDAAREGARYAMVRGNSWTSDCTAPGPANCIAQQADIQTFAQSAVPANASKLSVTATWLTKAGASCGSADSCKSPGSRVKVTATYTFAMAIPLVPQNTFTMSSSSQMTIAQ